MKFAGSQLGVAGWLAVQTAFAAAPAQQPTPPGKQESRPPTLSDARTFLEGRWTLESFELRQPGAEPIRLKGTGVLTYDAFGNLRMEIRTGETESDQLRAAGINIRDGIISTDGRTVIDLQNRTLTYFLDGQPSSLRTGGGPLATNRPRHWEVTADTLTLTTRDDTGAPLSISRWKRQ